MLQLFSEGYALAAVIVHHLLISPGDVQLIQLTL